MREVFFKNTCVAERAKNRPASYLAELERCVIRRDADGVWVDADLPEWQAMKAKYAPAREAESHRSRPTYEIPGDFDPEQERRRMKQGGCCGQPSTT